MLQYNIMGLLKTNASIHFSNNKTQTTVNCTQEPTFATFVPEVSEF
jgi:hypothetical protein